MASRNTQGSIYIKHVKQRLLYKYYCQAYMNNQKINPFHLSRFINNPSSAWVKMKGKMKKTDILLYKYFQSWINVYKRGSIRKVSFMKYELTLDWIIKLAPNLKLSDLDRVSYQQIINDYAECHERQTTMDFHHHSKRMLARMLSMKGY